MSLNSFRTGLGQITASPAGKWILFIVGAALTFSLVFSGLGTNLSTPAPSPANTPQEVVATLNGEPITRADYEQQVESSRQSSQQTVNISQTAALHDQALQTLIVGRLALQQAKKMGLTASDAEIQQMRQKMISQSGLAGKLGLKPNASIAEINSALQKNNRPPVDQIDAFSDDNLRKSVLLTKLQTTVQNQVTVSEQDARDAYQQYHTRHILIDNKKRSDVQAQTQAQKILAMAKAPGADFAALAKQYSDDPGTKAKGGDDGWIDQNTGYVPEFTKAAFALKPGQIASDLVKSPQFGYFIIKLEAIRSNLPKDFDKKKADYIAQVKQQKQGQKMQEFVGGLKDGPKDLVIKDAALRADYNLIEGMRTPADHDVKIKQAISDYQAALQAKPSATQAAEINCSLGQAYQELKQTPEAIKAYEAALQNSDDSSLHMLLGQLYQNNKETAKALEQYQAASKQAWDDPNIHGQLQQIYQKMKQPQLIAEERTWMDTYQKQMMQRMQAMQPPPGTPAPGAPAPGASGTAPAAGAPPVATTMPQPQAIHVSPAPPVKKSAP